LAKRVRGYRSGECKLFICSGGGKFLTCNNDRTCKQDTVYYEFSKIYDRKEETFPGSVVGGNGHWAGKRETSGVAVCHKLVSILQLGTLTAVVYSDFVGVSSDT
jgi:hypothetical protein